MDLIITLKSKIMKIYLILFLVIFCYCSCSYEPNVGNIQHLNMHEADYMKISSLMSKNKIYWFDLQNDTFSQPLKEVMGKCNVSSAFIIFNSDSSQKSIYYSVGLEQSYIHIFSQQDTTQEYKYCKAKLVRLKDRWYFWERARFGCVD